jgi:hypothetical protein
MKKEGRLKVNFFLQSLVSGDVSAQKVYARSDEVSSTSGDLNRCLENK